MARPLISIFVLKHKYWFYREIDDALKTGVSWGEYLDAMCGWVAERRTFEALQILGGCAGSQGLTWRSFQAQNP